MQDPNEDTDWNDVLRDFGIIPPKKEEKDAIEELVLKMQKEAAVRPYEKMTVDGLKEAEDTFQEEDEKAIQMYRQRRIKELKDLQKTQIYGELSEVPGNMYIKEVTNAEADVWVVLHLYRSSVPMCDLLNNHLGILAKKFPETKFLKAAADNCIPNYMDACVPTLLVYRNGLIKGRFIGMDQCGGTRVTPEELEWKLADVGAIKSDLEEDPRKTFIDLMMSSVKRSSIHWKDDVTD
ncbi:phosducin-like protein 2 isoform X2 [Rhinoderma darwinii]|uniref:phosducin-like protein 2 isoform X2 n=1 Tax=Rhinoderma darwinii TaxID=43563 RepID=UPI003F67D329